MKKRQPRVWGLDVVSEMVFKEVVRAWVSSLSEEETKELEARYGNLSIAWNRSGIGKKADHLISYGLGGEEGIAKMGVDEAIKWCLKELGIERKTEKKNKGSTHA